MTAEFAHRGEYEDQPLPAFNLAAHITERVLNEPTYRIDYTHPELVAPTAEQLVANDRLDVRTPFVYARGSNIGHFTLRVSAPRAPLAEIIPFPRQA
ncbi:MAG: hypothetical protein V4678_00145 [Patescibacteria group bacterium]